MKKYTFEPKGATAKERLGSSLKRYGAIQIVLGLGCVIMSLASIGIDRKNFDKLEREYKGEGIQNGTYTSSFDLRYVILGLDVGSLVSAMWVLVTGAVPAYMARHADYNLIRTKVVFMVFSIMATSLFVPVIVGAAITNYILRGSHMALAVMLGVLSLLEFLVSIASSVYCCQSPWAACKLQKKDKQKKDLECGDSEKQMSKEELPDYSP